MFRVFGIRLNLVVKKILVETRKIELNSYLHEDVWGENNGEHFFERTLDLIRL